MANSPFRYDFAVAYRVYPRIGREAPAVFNGDKFLLTHVAFHSFVRAMQGFKVKLWILLDGCPPSYEEFFRANWPGESLEIINYQNRGNGGTFQEQISILTEQNEAELCFVAEDDYFFLPDCFQKIHALFQAQPEVEFATPYDHLEFYLAAHQQMIHDVLDNGTLPFWRTVPSTTCSFAARTSSLRDCVHAFRSYGKPFLFNYGTDGTMWLAITKHRIFNLWYCVRCLFSAKYVAWSWLTAWTLCTTDILKKSKRRLWAPTPSLALHMVFSYPPPGINWDGLLKKAIAQQNPSQPAP